MSGEELPSAVGGSLPKYENPPVREVRIELVFQPLPIPVTGVGDLIGRFSVQYPEAEDGAPRSIGDLQLGTPSATMFRIAIVDRPPIPLIRLSNSNDAKFVEIQSDGFSCGWSKHPTGDRYPSYDSLRQEFRENATQFEAFCNGAEIGNIFLLQTRMTYYNQYDVPTRNSADALTASLNMVAPVSSLTASPNVVSSGLKQNYLFRTDSGVAYGALVVVAETAPNENYQRVQLQLTYSGDPFKWKGEEDEMTIEKIMDFFDEAHEVIVNTFTVLTTQDYHERWGRYR